MNYILLALEATTQSCLRKGIIILVLLSILSSICLSKEQSENQKAFLDITEILDAWEAAYGSIHSMKVKYTETINGLTDPDGNDNILYSVVERIQDRKKFYISYSSRHSNFSKSDSNIEAAFDGNVSNFCDHLNRRGTIDKGINTKGYELRNSLETYMLLSRYYINPDYPDGETYFSFWVRGYLSGSQESDNCRVKVRPELETILSEPCHVVECRYANTEMRFWMAHNKGMCPMKYEKIKGRDVVNRIEAQKIDKVMTDIGEVWYPSEIKRISVRPTAGKTQTYRCEVQEFEPYLDDIESDTFRVRFPDGIRIDDKVAGIWYVKGDTTHALDDLETEIGSSQVPLEPNRPRDSFNSKTTNETPGASNVQSEEPESGGILGDAQQWTGRKYGYVLVAGLALIVPLGILLYRRCRVIKKS